MTVEDLEAKFATRAVPYSGGLVLLEEGDALELIADARESGVRVLGVDGLFVSPTETRAPIEYIADFSNAVTGGWNESAAFIRSCAGLGLVFEVVLERSAATDHPVDRKGHRALIHWSTAQLQRGLPRMQRSIDPAWLAGSDDGWSLVVNCAEAPADAGAPTPAVIHFAADGAPHEALAPGVELSLFERQTGERARVEVLD